VTKPPYLFNHAVDLASLLPHRSPAFLHHSVGQAEMKTRPLLLLRSEQHRHPPHNIRSCWAPMSSLITVRGLRHRRIVRRDQPVSRSIWYYEADKSGLSPASAVAASSGLRLGRRPGSRRRERVGWRKRSMVRRMRAVLTKTAGSQDPGCLNRGGFPGLYSQRMRPTFNPQLRRVVD